MLTKQMIAIGCLFAALGEAGAATCTVSADLVAFGAYIPMQGSPLDSTGNVRVTCNENSNTTVSYSIALTAGSSGDYAMRKMASGAYMLDYNLYADAGYSQIWGDTTSGTVTVSGMLNITSPPGSAFNDHAVYGRAIENQNATPGAYTDTITVTVTY